MSNENEIRQFMVSYTDAFHSFDPARIAPFYTDTIMMMGNDGVRVIETETELEPMIDGLRRMLQSKGYARTEAPVFYVKSLDQQVAIVSCVWRRLDGEGNNLQQLGATYLLHAAHGRWKIASAALHGPDSVIEFA